MAPPQHISLEKAAALARSGDPHAQYALSSVLHERGQFDQSLHWLRLAAAQNLVPAQITLAAALMDGHRCPRDRQRALELLQPLAATQIQANLLLSELYGFAAFASAGGASAGGETALQYLSAAARLGDAGAFRQLAMLGACHRRWDLVRPLLDASATATAGAPILSVDWSALERSLPQLAADIELPKAALLHEAPLIRMFAGAIHPLVLDWIIKLASPLVQRSKIVDARTGEMRADPMRTSSHVTLGPRQHDHVLEALGRCISRVSGLPALNGEFLQILRYRPGEEFRPHVDYFNESGAGACQSLADGGQRAQTVLLYLNANYTGGSTYFPRLQLDIKARPGDMLQFHNVSAEGIGYQDSLHAGVPVITGEKWLLSQWIRSESYPARLAWGEAAHDA